LVEGKKFYTELEHNDKRPSYAHYMKLYIKEATLLLSEVHSRKDFAMDDKTEVSPYVWILALAVGVVATAAIGIWEFSQVQGALGILALGDKQGLEEITSVRQELASQREALEALKAQLAGAPHAPAAAAATPAAATPDSPAAHPKAKPHH
jgi:hypothetical protein